MKSIKEVLNEEVHKAARDNDRLLKHIGKLTKDLKNLQIITILLIEELEKSGSSGIKYNKETGLVYREEDI